LLINEPPDQPSLVLRRNVAARQCQVVLGLADDDNLDLVAARRTPRPDSRLDRRPTSPP
jgi:hypothetical protein